MSIPQVDVVLLTKNSMKPCLNQCLLSVKREVPVCRLILVDGGSTDGTIEVCKAAFPRCEVIYDVRGNRATARQIGIDAVETDWFVFMDSDVILRSGWFQNIWKHTNRAGVGAIQGATYQRRESKIQDFDYAMRKIRGFLGGITYKPFLEPEHRGFTGDILIKTELVRDIQIPKILHFWEDHYIKKWIENKGFLWLRAYDAMCDHMMINRSPKPAIHASYVGYTIGFVNVKRSILALCTIIPKILLALCIRPNLRMAVFQLRFQVYSVVGVLKAKLTVKHRQTDIQKVMQFKFGTRKEELKDYGVI